MSLSDLDDDLADRRARRVLAAARGVRARFGIEDGELAGTKPQRLDGHAVVESDVLLLVEIARRRRIEPPDANDLRIGKRNLDVEVLVMDLGASAPPLLQRRLLDHRVGVFAVERIPSVRQALQVPAPKKLHRLREMSPELRIVADSLQGILDIDAFFLFHGKEPKNTIEKIFGYGILKM